MDFSRNGKQNILFGHFLKTGNQFQIDKPGSKPLWHGIGDIRKIFYKEIGNGVLAIDHIENFQRCPDIFQFAKRIMTSPVGFIIIQQQCTET